MISVMIQQRSDYSTKLFGLQWQGVPFKDVSGEYQVRISGEQLLANSHASTHEPD